VRSDGRGRVQGRQRALSTPGSCVGTARLPVSTRTLRGCLVGESQLNKELIPPLLVSYVRSWLRCTGAGLTDRLVWEMENLQGDKANKFLARLALLVGREALSRPATAQKPLGRRGRATPPCPPPPAPLAARHLPWLGYAHWQPEASKKSPPSAEDRGQLQSKTHDTANSAESAMSEFRAPWIGLICASLETERRRWV
jgi:hypothetical protein